MSVKHVRSRARAAAVVNGMLAFVLMLVVLQLWL
jgi:hypothetical protein